MKHSRITAAEDNLVKPVFWQTRCCAFGLVNLGLFVQPNLILSAIPDLKTQCVLHAFAYYSLSCLNYVTAMVSLT
jgi:hypothetical protein